MTHCVILKVQTENEFSVVIAEGKHRFPSRTHRLSPPAPMVLGKTWESRSLPRIYIYLYKEVFLDSSAVEHSAVNRRVVGSNPTRGAIFVFIYFDCKTID